VGDRPIDLRVFRLNDRAGVTFQIASQINGVGCIA
jgi:hypothetical protein